MMKKPSMALCAALVGLAAAAGATSMNQTPRPPEIQTGDVALFYRLYDATNGRPTAAQLQRDYLDAGTDGLRSFASARNTTADRIAAAIAAQPQLYADARRCADTLPRVKPRLAQALAALSEIYPTARLPPVTIAVGRGKPVGIGSPVTGLQIGLEALCGVTYFAANLEDRFVHVISHEYVHVQQQREMVDATNPTVLEASLMEGGAEFIGELISGGVTYAQHAQITRGREAEIEAAFAADMDKRDLSAWLYNGTMDKAGDLGYWVGYRICKAYYKNATDKQAAVRDIIEMRDAKAFLARSGWRPGMAL